MPTASASPSTRPLRADAQRNRDAILTAARETFVADGVFASLDGIALRAGVGNATLYRNFPTRDDLLAAVIQDSITVMLGEADDLHDTLPPREALAEWLRRLTWQLRIWHDLPSCVVTVLADAASPMATACAPLLDRTDALLDDARAVGALADGVTAADVFELITALSWGADRFGDSPEVAARRVRLATAGLFTSL